MATKATKKTQKKTTATKKGKTKEGLPKEQTIADYRAMLLIRRFEEKAGQLYGMGLIGGFCHLYIGQEAVVVGIQGELIEGDSVITGYRDHGHMLACGMDASGVMAELTGRIGGYSKGKGGSMHMFSHEKNFYGGHGIVAAQIPLGTGLSFAHKYRKDGQITTAYIGDGGLNQGQVYESFNMAALWKLPVIYVIENNRYAMGTAVGRAAAGAEALYKRGQAYGIAGAQADGMDVTAVRAATQEAVAYVRSGKGPYILEMQTYRYRGHSMSDPAKYRSKEEVQDVRSKYDPIENLKEKMLQAKIVSEDDLKSIDREIKAEISKAAEFAQSSLLPDESELWTDVLAS